MWLLFDARGDRSIKAGFWDELFEPRFEEYQRQETSFLEFLEQQTEVRTAKGIVVIPGPGGFSTVRTAALLANLATFALKIPALTIKAKINESLAQVFKRGVCLLKSGRRDKTVKPIYAGLPNITTPKMV